MQTSEIATSPNGQRAPIKFGNLLINFTTEFHRIWDSKGSGSKPGSFWRPTPAPDTLPGYFPLGDFATPGFDNINGNTVVAVVCEGPAENGDTSKGKALSAPEDFERVWKDSNSRADADCTIWRPIPPTGYVALGMVCSNGRDKPLPNTVRCVREDLVVASSVSNTIWSDNGSGARQDFSAWAIDPPSAEAGEIYFSPGTFIGINSHGRPAANTVAYSLRMQVALQVAPPPAPPVLSGHESPAAEEMPTITQTARLPWFAVIDPDLTPLEQFQTSPFYRLERSDRYVLVGHGHNTGTVGQTFKWTAPRVQRSESLEQFTDATTIRVASEWPLYVSNPMNLHVLLSASIRFSAKLSKAFTHTETSHIGWTTSAAVEVITRIAKKTSVAVYVIESRFRLLREDGAQVANDVLYTEIDSLYLTEYPPETDSKTATSTQQPAESVATDNAP
ncbi:Vps62-related protein [Pseudomonas putida]|uniref:Vps62-related protein n=1 Tax=Pseudomonas putida TaxID=303 RepID=UPI003D981F94